MKKNVLADQFVRIGICRRGGGSFLYKKKHLHNFFIFDAKLLAISVTLNNLTLNNLKTQAFLLLFRLSIRKKRNICARGGFFFLQTNFDFLTSHF